ncbi:MAG: hypothetical protein MUF00_04245 [Gemmatimonadaceae bacterium]|jgi:hypothetical protein|nr:hypothetical protein [Gemmatimonadaceae bacterium]
MRHAILITLLLVAACTTADDSPTQPAPRADARSYRMGFSHVPPSDDFPLAVRSLESWARRADAAIIHQEPPWTALLSGEPVARVAEREYDGLVNFWRQRGFELVIVVDPSNGVARETDSDNLRRAGRSMREPAIQALYREWVRTLVTRYRPVAIGLAVETNLIRDAAPAALYQAIVRVANDAAADVRAIDASMPRFITIQVEHAWGRLVGTNRYVGVEQDFRDFPFTEWVGLSSYPYLGRFDEPEQVPDDWYRRPLGGRTLPTVITEGGWSSGSNASFRSSPEKQARWLRRQGALADAIAPRYLFQLTFSDLTTRTFGNDPRLSPFLQLGVVDTTLAPKPALAVWDSLFARRRSR